MSHVLPKEIETYIDRGLSHLISRIEDPELPGRIRSYLQERGTAIIQQSSFRDEQDVEWMVFSFKGESARSLVLELFEMGFPESILGIDAQAGQGAGSEGWTQ